jgi:hypothetical protein
MRRRLAATILGVAGAILIAACSGTPPTTPTPPTGGGGGPTTPPPNNLPVIDSITIQGTRSKEPANFADLGESVPVVAKVHDDETAADQLEYQWTATTGTFTGTGASVVWMAPAAATTPADVTITLKLVEKYGYPGGPLNFSHDVSGNQTLSLHDSAGEVGGMARQFLLDFSDSTIRDVPYIMRNFTNATKACAKGKANETDDVTNNRVNYFIKQWSVGQPAVSVIFSTVCPFRQKGADACAQVAVDWVSTRLTKPEDPGGTPLGGTEHVLGIDQVTAIYVAEQKKWGLCESDFNGRKALYSNFIR